MPQRAKGDGISGRSQPVNRCWLALLLVGRLSLLAGTSPAERSLTPLDKGSLGKKKKASCANGVRYCSRNLTAC